MHVCVGTCVFVFVSEEVRTVSPALGSDSSNPASAPHLLGDAREVSFLFSVPDLCFPINTMGLSRPNMLFM